MANLQSIDVPDVEELSIDCLNLKLQFLGISCYFIFNGHQKECEKRTLEIEQELVRIQKAPSATTSSVTRFFYLQIAYRVG